MPSDPEPSPKKPAPDRAAAHWPNPAGEYAAGAEEQRQASGVDEDAARLERTDPKSLRSAAPGDGTGVTGTVPPT
jgi:hypothetical protein